VRLAERVSGDTSVGHSLAFCEAVEAVAGVEAPRRARYLRVVLLELERLYNHVGDFGAIVNDTGFAVAHAHCYRIRERLLRLNKRLTGSRLLRGALVPGGVGADLAAGAWLVAEVESALADFREIVDISLENTLVLDRLDGTGVRARGRRPRRWGRRPSVSVDVDTRRDRPLPPTPSWRSTFRSRAAATSKRGRSSGGEAPVGGSHPAGVRGAAVRPDCCRAA
jgi:NADH:ubiquinone oxidoreductase subunit D